MLSQQRGPWKIDADFTCEALHVRPRADLVWHPLAADCHCLPTEETCQLRDEDGRLVDIPVYFHAALDARDVTPPRPGVAPAEPV